MADYLSLERARELLVYDADTGSLTWAVGRGRYGNRARAGAVAGWEDPDGYRQVRVDRRAYLAHRIVWLLTYGVWPDGIIDHINRDPRDNRVTNLRLCTHPENHANTNLRSDNTSGIKGVSWAVRQRKWVARIRANGRVRHLGYFASKDDAAAAYATAAAEHFGAFAHPARAAS